MLALVGEVELIFDDAVYPVNQEAVDEWAAYREEDMKKKLTPRALKMVAKRLSQWPHDHQMKAVERSIEHNWLGIHYQMPQASTSTKSTTLAEDLNDRSWA